MVVVVVVVVPEPFRGMGTWRNFTHMEEVLPLHRFDGRALNACASYAGGL